MPTTDVILVILSGLGVIHGLFLAIFLWTSKGTNTANQLLGFLLIVLSFRIGKSVFLEFTENLDAKLIFTGLGSILALGPLFYLFVLSGINRKFQLNRRHLLHFIPLPVAIGFGLWINNSHLTYLPIAFFVALFSFYYLHFLFYLFFGYYRALQKRKQGIEEDIYHFIRLLFFGLLAVWIVYVLNLFDDNIPYIIGPILYSVVVYGISFTVIRKGYIAKLNHKKYQTTAVSNKQADEIYAKVLNLMIEKEQFKNPDLTLKSLGVILNVSTQVLSMVINQKSQQNFNSFINNYRIIKATRLFSEEKFKNHTIAAVAFEVGFNSISSFNTAFKSQTGKTPLAYRNEVLK